MSPTYASEQPWQRDDAPEASAWLRVKQFGKILASAGLFTCLGVGGLLYTLVALPLLAALPGGAERRRARARRLIHHSFRLFVVGLEGSGILKVVPENLPAPGTLGGTLILANHPSYLDIVMILALLPDAVCVVKNEVWRNPFFGPLVRAAGFVPILRAEATLGDAEAALTRGLPLVLFPEGTRTRRDQPLKFHRGAAHLALRTGAPILPLVIHVDPPLLEKGDKWYHIPLPTCRFLVRAERFAPCEDRISGLDSEPLRSRRWTESLEAFYQDKLHELQHPHP